ncbi:Resolvase, N terminal domain [Mesorhizobium albiziae]|uniref:Resolvase, N terminal domain n=1 Tax=Neomesorhizobium albiziae TaxID=335020 RepID=A0A1I4F745_9HYPH|nr:hypothetical protein GCM10007937_25360 [Mesorhizobium albiziae]SFL12667.1 Resolvase, N terminal domain [Mesorhizobium albiziae]
MGSARTTSHARSVAKGDTVVVWKLDRLSRSLKDVLHIMETISVVGAGFRSLTEAIDTTTPAGRMMMQMELGDRDKIARRSKDYEQRFANPRRCSSLMD